MKWKGLFWRLAWQHPWESELAATRSAFKTFLFLKVLGVLGLRLLSPISMLNQKLFTTVFLINVFYVDILYKWCFAVARKIICANVSYD